MERLRRVVMAILTMEPVVLMSPIPVALWLLWFGLVAYITLYIYPYALEQFTWLLH